MELCFSLCSEDVNATGFDVMQYIYVAEDRRDFNSRVEKMILSSGITVPVLGLFF